MFRKLLATVAVGLALVAAVAFLPRLLLGYDLGPGAGPLTVAERARATNDIRQTLMQAMAGIAVALGAFAAWRRLRINEEELRATRDGQVTERYTRAIEQLGNASIDVRIGGIFALRRIAVNSAGDRDSIVAVLSAYVRGHADGSARLDGLPHPVDPDDSAITTMANRANDIQSALVVLGSIPPEHRTEEIRLPGTDLRRARLTGLRFDGAGLGGAVLRGARLTGCSLVGADLRWTDLRDAELSGAVLTHARTNDQTLWPDGFDPATAGVRVEPDPAAS